MKDALEDPRFLSRKNLAQTSHSYDAKFSLINSPASSSPDRWKKQKQNNNNKTRRTLYRVSLILK